MNEITCKGDFIIFNFNKWETIIMPKTYALVEVMDTLINEDMDYNLSLIDTLLENNITDIYLFSDMTLSREDIQKVKELILVLQGKGITVHGVLTTPDLFWGIDPQQLSNITQIQNMRDQNILSPDNIYMYSSIEKTQIVNAFNQFCPVFANSLTQLKPKTQDILGAAYREIETPGILKRAANASLAARIFLKCYPVPERNIQGFLLTHFMQNKPVDCANCVIFYSKEENHPGYGSTLQTLMFENNDINIMKVKVNQEDFDNPMARINYNSSIRILLPKQPTISNIAPVTNSIAELADHQNSEMPRWFSDVITKDIEGKYNWRRGFKFFGYSSDDSLKVLAALKSENLNNRAKYTIIERYLSQEQNKGKRLYDVLLEAKVHHTTSEQDNVSDVWLTEDMLYIIKQKYKYERGFKFFGRSCPDSINLLNQLNEAQINDPQTNDPQTGLAGKQKLIDDYLANPVHQGKRLFYILDTIRNWNRQVADRYRYQSYQLKG